MSIQATDELDQFPLPHRRRPAPSSFAPRAAGLYSEVTWDRSWTALARERPPARGAADRKAPPSE